MEIKNRRANFDYQILETEVAGVKLMGSELKPLRAGKCSISECYIYIKEDDNSVWIKNMYIKNESNNAYSHEEIRDRRLLMTKKQVKHYIDELQVRGITIVPIKGYFDERQNFKLLIGLAKGKKNYDKKESIKANDAKIEIARALSER